jgi:hypothetical protein
LHELGRTVETAEDTMQIAADTMKVIGSLLIVGLAACSDDFAPGFQPQPQPQACSLESSDCQPWWPQQSSDADVTPKSISYNALTADSLMFNALLRNARANVALTRRSLLLLLESAAPEPGSDVEYVQRQLQDPFARRMMEYLVGCALPEGHVVYWLDPVSESQVIWEGELGLCPVWAASPISEDQACQELLSACLLARNNADGVEVLISVRKERDSVSGDTTLPLGTEAAGGEPCTLDSFAPDCSPEGETWGPESNCPGQAGAWYPGRWRSQHIGTCTADAPVSLGLDVANCTGERLVRVCSGIYGCDSSSPEVLSSTRIGCGTASHPIDFTCTDKEAFTVMYANADPNVPADDFRVSAISGAVYPASEKQVFRWQEGAFYGNLFCDDLDCGRRWTTDNGKVVDTSLWVEVPVPQDPAAPTVVYHWAPRAWGENGAKISTPVYFYSSEGDPLQQRADGHRRFLQETHIHDGVAYQYIYDDVVYGQMHACVSPNWDPFEAYLKRRRCAGTDNAEYCAAHSTGRCWSFHDEPCQCNRHDALDMAGSRIDDWRYGDCGSTSDYTTRWQHPLTVFLNDPCDIVRESEYPAPGEVTCEATPLCRQTSSPLGPWEIRRLM